eukprot:scaffold32293_cov67-Phaeocystis_antarctica.AAC.2
MLSTEHHRLLRLEDVVPVRGRRPLLTPSPPASAAAAGSSTSTSTSTKASELSDRSCARKDEPRGV